MNQTPQYEKLRIRYHTLALAMETIGVVLLWWANDRVDGMFKLVRYGSFTGEPGRFNAWYYHAETVGFLLVVAGVLLHARRLWLEHAHIKPEAESTPTQQREAA